MVGGPGIIGWLGTYRLLMILGVVVLLFGATRIPRLPKALGRSVEEFKKGRREGADESKEAAKDEAKND